MFINVLIHNVCSYENTTQFNRVHDCILTSVIMLVFSELVQSVKRLRNTGLNNTTLKRNKHITVNELYTHSYTIWRRYLWAIWGSGSRPRTLHHAEEAEKEQTIFCWTTHSTSWVKSYHALMQRSSIMCLGLKAQDNKLPVQFLSDLKTKNKNKLPSIFIFWVPCRDVFSALFSSVMHSPAPITS